MGYPLDTLRMTSRDIQASERTMSPTGLFSLFLSTGGSSAAKKSHITGRHLEQLITGMPRTEHITPALQSLHWLPVRQRILFK